MERELLITGIGGQGIQLVAQVLARAATLEGREVMYLGLYGGMLLDPAAPIAPWAVYTAFDWVVF